MKLFSLIAIVFFVSLLIAIKQKTRGLSFWSSFFISLIAIAGIFGTVWKILANSLISILS